MYRHVLAELRFVPRQQPIAPHSSCSGIECVRRSCIPDGLRRQEGGWLRQQGQLTVQAVRAPRSHPRHHPRHPTLFLGSVYPNVLALTWEHRHEQAHGRLTRRVCAPAGLGAMLCEERREDRLAGGGAENLLVRKQRRMKNKTTTALEKTTRKNSRTPASMARNAQSSNFCGFTDLDVDLGVVLVKRK
eukprot:129171-Rhodomonas_salina.1